MKLSKLSFLSISLTACVLALLIAAGCSRPAAKGPRVFFVSPTDGATVSSPVKFQMGVEGMTIKPAGAIEEGTGHHHILINVDPMAKGTVIPADATHHHYGKGQTEAEIELAPGSYKLTLQFADGLHQSYGPELAQTINVTVQ